MNQLPTTCLQHSLCLCKGVYIKDAARYGFVDGEREREREREREGFDVRMREEERERERKKERKRERPCLADLSSFASIQLSSVCLFVRPLFNCF